VLVSVWSSVSGGPVWLGGGACAGGGVAAKRVRRRTVSVLALTVACVLALGASVARAEPPKLISYGQFSAGDSKELMPVGVAVDQSSGNVFVADLISRHLNAFGHVDKFSAAGEPLKPPSPFGEGLDASVAVNPVNGDAYVLEGVNFGTGRPEIATYDSNGKPVGSNFPVAPSNNYLGVTTVQIAADSAGNVYVPVIPQNEVLEYSPAGVLLSTFTGGSGSGALSKPSGVAVDSSGNVWVADTGDNRIEELSSAGAPVAEVKSEGVESVALDGHGDVFAIVTNSQNFCGGVKSPCPHLVEYDSAGVQVADVGAGSFGSTSNSPTPPSMVAVGEATGRVYVSDPGKELVWIFGPPTAPVVGRELTSEVTTSEAKLGALVNPGGIPASYRFEYGASSAYGYSTPFPEGNVGEGLSSRTVWAAASGLAPGTTYHYRVVAMNELGTVYGPDQTFTTLTSAQAACPNGEFRGGFSVRLPDCRAYELVTPSTKFSSQPWQAGPAASDGNAFGFHTEEPLPGAPTAGDDYLVTRGAGGWTSQGIIPLESYTGILCPNSADALSAYSSEMSKAVIAYGSLSRASEGAHVGVAECNSEGLQVVQGEPVGYTNLLVRDNTTGTYRLVNAPPAGVTPADAHFEGASADLSHVVFTEMAPLTPNAPYGVENLFEWDEGVLRLVTMVNGAPVAGSLAAQGSQAVVVRPISADGSHILFTSGNGLYSRIDGERTVQVDEAQGGPGSSGGGTPQTASADGSRIFFLDGSRLTADSTAQAGEPDLYECVLPAGASKCELSDLTVAKAGEHADVLQASMLGGKDSSHMYFIAQGVLAANTREYTDSQGKTVVEEAKGGENNLYVEQDGTTTFIATLFVGDFGTGAVSPDGTWFAFDSAKSLTGYENVAGNSHIHVEEIFLYNASNKQLVCVSCDPSGEAPSAGGAQLRSFGQRPLADGGRVFFESEEALVPSDTNGQLDLYEFEDGQPFLISSGTSTNELLRGGESFAGASESGDDVFFRATQQLVPQDTNEKANVVYDARVNGGFPAIASPPACTTADACRTAVSPQPSIYGEPSSQTFSGVGNLIPSPEAKKRAKPKKTSKVCKRGKHRRARCAARARRTRSKAKSHKGGK
jgi:Mala s 1-like protein